MAQIREELVLYDKFTQTFTRYIRLGEQAAGATNQAKRAVDQFTKSQKSAATASNTLTNSIRGLVGAYLSLRGVQAVLNMSDTLASTRARIDMMNDGLQTTEELNQMIYESAQRSRGSYAETAAFVAKLGNLAGSAFDSSAEIVAFAEQINKQMVLSGTTTQEAQAAMLQLTQGLSSGTLRGEELNSVLEQTPMIAKTIADYMGVTTGEMRELASEGKLTAEVVKNAMFAAAEETNAKFEEMPMTWGQVWTQMQNVLIETFQPILDIVGALSDWIGNNMDIAIAAFYGLAAAATFYAVAQWIATGAAKAFFTTLLTNPLTYIALAIAVVIAAIYSWIQSVGGLKIAWLIVVDAVLYAWDTLKAGFFTGVYFVMDLFDTLSLKIQAVGVSIANWMGDMKVNVLTILQNMVNGAIDIINWFIEKINTVIPVISINPIEHLTFAATAAAENEAAKAQRNEALEAARAEAEQKTQERADKLANMWSERDANHAARQAEIQAQQAAQMANPGGGSSSYDEISSQLDDISSNVGSINKSVSMSEEDLESLVDVAERRYVNNINLTNQTPVINITGQNTGNTAADRQGLANAIRDILVSQAASGSIRSTAHAF